MTLMDIYNHCPGDQQLVYTYTGDSGSISRYRMAAEIANDKHRHYIITHLFCANSIMYAKVVAPGD